jgi:hypothetical protein
MLVLKLLESWLQRRTIRRRSSSPLRRRMLAQPFCRPELELLEDRLPPGSLLSLGVPTSNPFTDPLAAPSDQDPMHTQLALTSTLDVSTPPPSSLLSDPTPAASSGDAGVLAPVVVDAAPDLGPLFDSSSPSNPDAGGGGGPGSTPTTSVVAPLVDTPTAPASGGALNSTAPASVPAAVAAPAPVAVASDVVGGGGGSTSTGDAARGSFTPKLAGSALTVTLRTPAVTQVSSPIVQVAINENVQATAVIDVDLDHNGQFTGNELAYATGTVFGGAFAQIPLANLPTGSFLIRARVDDGTTQAQAFASINVNPSDTGRPISFEPNLGQLIPQAAFLARGTGYTAMLGTDGSVTIDAPSDATDATQLAFQVSLFGANPNPTPNGIGLLPGVTNYFIGNDPSLWRTNVGNYSGAELDNVYNGVDAVYAGVQGNLSNSFIVHPGANVGQIQLDFHTWGRAYVDTNTGQLVINKNDASYATFYAGGPIAYQTVGNARVPVQVQYVELGDGRIGFQVGGYDPSLPLVIDPPIIYSSFLGGSNDDFGNAVAADAAGNGYYTGNTRSNNFLQINPAQGAGLASTLAFITKVNNAGQVVYSTFLGSGANGVNNSSNAIAVDPAGAAYIIGTAGDNKNFPITNQLSVNGANQPYNKNGQPIYVLKLNPAGNTLGYSVFVASHFFGGEGTGIAVDALGQAYYTGWIAIPDFVPTTVAFQGNNDPKVSSTNKSDGDAGIFGKISVSGKVSLLASYLTGTGAFIGNFTHPAGIALDPVNEIYITGTTTTTDFPTVNPAQPAIAGNDDAFVAKLNPAGSAMVFGTYLGGTGKDDAGVGASIAADAAGNCYVTGTTASVNFPTTAGAFQQVDPGSNNNGYAAAYNTAGQRLYSSYLGSPTNNKNNGGHAVAVDSNHVAYYGGFTDDDLYPQLNAVQSPLTARNSQDGFVTALNSNGTAVVFSTNYGGLNTDVINGIALDPQGAIFVTGNTQSLNGSSDFFPIVNAFQSTNGGKQDAFVAKLTPVLAQTIVPTPPVPPAPPSGGGGGGGPTGPVGALFPPDRFEPNNTEDQATNLSLIFGNLKLGASNLIDLPNLTIANDPVSNLPDYDWFKFTPAANGTLTLTLTLTAGNDLELHLFTFTSGSSFNDVVASVQPGLPIRAVTFPVQSGKQYWIEVKGFQPSFGVFNQGQYNLDVELS